MLVSELAKEFNTTTAVILGKLKTLRLKAIDGKQDLSKVVVTVLRSELVKDLKIATATRVAAKAAKMTARQSAFKVVEKAKAQEPVVEKKKATKKAASKKGVSKKNTIVPELQEQVIASQSSGEDKVVEPVVVEPVPAKVETVQEQPPAVEAKIDVPVAITPAKVVTPAPVAPLTAEEEAKGFVPLKPLAKKKRRVTGRSDSSRGAAEANIVDAGSAEAETVMANAVVEPGELKELEIQLPISVKDFAVRIQEKTSVVLKKLMEMGVLANINQNLSEGVVRALAQALGYAITQIKTKEEKLIEIHKAEEEDPALLSPRGPVVTFMGHVDHGKTSLLDSIRKSRVADKEHGGITQHIGAYSVVAPKGRVTFLDTPGHEAFTAMRARGAHITDIVVIVIAADEGIMPQTEEAIDHARAAGVPIVIALNKIDKRHADIDRVKKQLAEHNLTPEDWGGTTIVVGVSAVTGEGIDKLLEMMFLEAEMLELRANSQKKASGIVVEAHMSRGKGSLATLIVQSGTLRTNDMIVVGQYYGRVKAMFDDYEKPISEAGPSMPVEILGLPGVPDAGEMFYIVDNEEQAREITSVRVEQLKHERLHATSKITLEDLYTQIQQGKVKELNVILKADVQGSVEAIKDSLNKISTAEVKVNFIHTGVGDVNAADIILAFASNAIIIAFQIGVGVKAAIELEKQPVDVRRYRIIYDAVNDVKKAMEGLLEPKKRRKFISRIEVRQVFKLSKGYTVAGCFVLKGKISRKATVDVVRNGETIHTGAISGIKRFKDDVKEVNEGYECGIFLEKFEKFEVGDILEAFETESIARTL
ncbi:MAG: translation initiation factor IF-2 [Candidatus Omnitrophica bacterium]|nr:translation initiation factor IF-2 [Candidatus Omnitrophota bacterium]